MTGQEQILASQCPRCQAPPGVRCDRGPAVLAGVSGGKSHYERLLAAQGHSPAEAVRLAGENVRKRPPGNPVKRSLR